MSAWADFYRAAADAHRATARAARIDPGNGPAEREERGQFYDHLAADYERMAAEEEAHA